MNFDGAKTETVRQSGMFLSKPSLAIISKPVYFEVKPEVSTTDMLLITLY